jgi:aminopeptidase
MPIDSRTQKLAKLIVNYSVKVKSGENVIISGGIEAQDFITALYKEVVLKGAHPILRVSLPGVTDFFYKYAKKHQIEKFPDHFDYMVKKADKYIGINTTQNTKELTSCDPRKVADRQKVIMPITDYVVNAKPNIYRVTVGFPCMAMAQEAEMSLNEYEKFVYSACLIDWKKLGKSMDKILKKFKKGKTVWLKGKNVDLKFNIHGKKAIADKGEENMPGGEVFMAPVRTSLNGWIKFEYPAIKLGREVADIYLKFKNGEVVEYDASKNKEVLKSILETDKNAKFVGEFGIGLNPGIKKYTKDLLFDEKIHGTIHLALGMAYTENGGGNDSAVHWDIVKDMKSSQIYLDGKIVFENGRWKV